MAVARRSAMTDSQTDSFAMLTAVDAANRVLLAAWRAHPPHGTKTWQFQAGLYVIPDYCSPGGECIVVKMWAPTWLEAALSL
jgi:hypothetical protein